MNEWFVDLTQLHFILNLDFCQLLITLKLPYTCKNVKSEVSFEQI